MCRALRAYEGRIYHNSGEGECNNCAIFSCLTFGGERVARTPARVAHNAVVWRGGDPATAESTFSP